MEANVELYTKYLTQIGKRITCKGDVYVIESVIAYYDPFGGITFRCNVVTSEWSEIRLTLEEVEGLEGGEVPPQMR